MGLLGKLSKQEKSEWLIDPAEIKWRPFLANFAYGLKKFVLKEPATIPTMTDTSDLVEEAMSSRYFNDIAWAYNL